MAQLNPYLNFAGQTEEALRVYADALRGELKLQHFRDAPFPVDDAMKDRVLHGLLTFAGGQLMASDGTPDMTFDRGTMLHICVRFDDDAALEHAWRILSSGATITQPVVDAFWGDRWGTLVDRFGIPWMVMCAQANAG